MSHRRERLESVILRTVQTILAEGMADPRLDALFTVTRVRVSSDRRDATVYLTMTPESREPRALHGLAAAAPFLKRELSRRAAIHRPPDLAFKIDTAHKKQAAVLEALQKIERERAEHTDPTPAPIPAAETDPDDRPDRPDHATDDHGDTHQ